MLMAIRFEAWGSEALCAGRGNQTDVQLSIQREGHGNFDVITRAIIQIQPVKWRVEEDVGVVRVTHLFRHRRCAGTCASGNKVPDQ